MDKELDAVVAAHSANVHRAPEHLVQQWHKTIDEAAAMESGRQQQHERSWHPSSFFWGVAVTAALAIGVGLGYLLSNGDDHEVSTTPTLAVSTSPQPRSVPGAFSRGLQVHLRDSRMRLTSPGDATDNEALILQIIAQNRMFESAADRNNAPQLARVLRAFEPILLQLAATDIAPEDAEALRAQLAFELNVMLTKLASESSDDSQTT
jgi:hypothetical protein